MRRVIDLTEMLEDQDERRHEELVRQQLDWCSSWRSPRIAFSAGQCLPLLRSWWSSRLTSTTGPKSFSPPIQHSVFGLTTLQDFLLAFFLHQEGKVGPKYSWQIHPGCVGPNKISNLWGSKTWSCAGISVSGGERWGWGAWKSEAEMLKCSSLTLWSSWILTFSKWISSMRKGNKSICWISMLQLHSRSSHGI